MRSLRAFFVLASSLSFLAQAQPSLAQMSPADWPAAHRVRLEKLAQSPFPPTARTVRDKSVLISATLSPEAAYAGMRALDAGGTAADAAVTVALTQVATDLGAVVSYAGVAELVYYEAKTGKVSVMDAGWAAWSGETDPATIPAIDLSVLGGRGDSVAAGQGRKTLVPGFMAGMEAMHSRFGVLPFADLFKPAVWYAEKGVTVSPLLAGYFQTQQRYLARTAEGRRFMGLAGNALPKAGDRFVQPELAATLRAVAVHGSQEMYGGAWGQAYVAAVQAEGGKASLADMRAYKPSWTEPLSTSFAGATVYGPDASNPSSCQILEALNLLEAQPEAAAPYWQDASSFLAYFRSLRFVTYAHYSPGLAKIERELGFKPGCAARLTPAYGRALAPRMAEVLSTPVVPVEPGHHSASVVVVDKFGNVAVLVHSINAVTWGDTGIVVGGIPVSNAGGLYKGRMTGLGPDRKIPSDMAPVIALRKGKPVLAIATIGASLVPETVRLAGLLRRPEDIASLAAAPPLLINIDPYGVSEAVAHRIEVVPRGGYSSAMLASLKEAGLQLREEVAPMAMALRGTAAFGLREKASGRWITVETPQVLTFAADP
jgi:gamma-glutamyltranspeptidase/glutathione hydrolase